MKRFIDYMCPDGPAWKGGRVLENGPYRKTGQVRLLDPLIGPCVKGGISLTDLLPNFDPVLANTGHRLSSVGMLVALSVLPCLGLPPHTVVEVGQTVRVRPSDSTRPLQQAIDACRARGGGTVVAEAGTHRLDRALRFHDAVNITLTGEGTAYFEMAEQVIVTAAEAAEKGQNYILLQGRHADLEDVGLEIQAPGRVDTTPRTGRRRQIPYMSVEAGRIEGNRLTLRAPLAYPVPAGAKIVTSYNAVQITGLCRGLRFENLVIGGNRARWPVRPLNHSTHCGIFAVATYSYEKGPLAEPVKNVVFNGVTVRGFHHRGIAFYNVTDSALDGCRIEDTGGEAIDLDHFTFRSKVVDCRVRRAPVGVELNDASHCSVVSSLIEDCTTGIRLWRWCTLDGLNTGNRFVRNTIRRAAKEGIYLATGTRGSKVTGNTVADCAIGIRIAGDDSLVQGNTLHRCREKLLVAGKGNQLLDLIEE